MNDSPSRQLPKVRKNFITNYDHFVDQWWDPRGHFAMLNWIAQARAGYVPEAEGSQALLLDIACGGGLFGPHLAGKGYRLVGLDLSAMSLREAKRHGYDAVMRTDITRIPLASESVDVVAAGQCLEHVPDPAAVVEESCRVLRPGGTLVLDTLADTMLARLLVITVAENVPLPGGPPRGTHDHRLFVNRQRLVDAARRGGVELRLVGLRQHLGDWLKYVAHRRDDVRLCPVKSTSVLYLAVGTKA
jgi:2-polyprenyl-6-hydroxyphenyl methylase / 3-demethylubiquinone-9 3-methyltransferase